MTPPEYIQLKAFARIDGALLSLLWLLSFGCYVAGLSSPLYGMVSLVLILATPFFVAFRLRKFRDEDLEGIISFLRAWAYVILMLFYAGIVFAVGQYLYFAYMDGGYLMQTIGQAMAAPETAAMIEQMNMGEAVNEGMHAMQAMRPIDIALNALTMNISMGIALGLPVAAIMQKRKK